MQSGRSFHFDADFAAATIARIPVFKAFGRIDQESQMIAKSGSSGACVFWGVSVPSAPDCAPLVLSDPDFPDFSADCSTPLGGICFHASVGKNRDRPGNPGDSCFLLCCVSPTPEKIAQMLERRGMMH